MELHNLDYIYNFKNSIRFFVHIAGLDFSTLKCDIDNLSWTSPLSVKIQKNINDNTSVRLIKMPNIINFYACYKTFENADNFYDINKISTNSRLTAEIETGDFTKNAYNIQIHDDFKCLCTYDNLIKLDIKSFYDYIYTHELNLCDISDRYISNQNEGKTNGIIMGSYISLYIAEVYLKKISDQLNTRIREERIKCNYTYFSDDFYFFCDKSDINKVKEIFSNVLLNFNLYRNENKDQIFDYFTYSEYNKIDKYWKKLEYENTSKNNSKPNKKHYYLNHLISYKEKIHDNKIYYTYIMGFFKSKYFENLPSYPTYSLEKTNIHQILILYKNFPESIIYSIKKYSCDPLFVQESIDFFRYHYNKALQETFWEKQLYFYYALVILNDIDFLQKSELLTLVKNSYNQILLSYYVKDSLFNNEEMKELLSEAEDAWFINYNTLCKLSETDEGFDIEKEVKKYLIPKKCKQKNQDNYINFYTKNITAKNYIISDIEDIIENISKYVDRRK